MPNIQIMKELIFIIFDAKKVFNYLKQAFIKVLILYYYDPKSHIWVKTNRSSYVIRRVLSQLSIN